MSTRVTELLTKLDDLTEAERSEFESELARRREAEYERASEELRQFAVARGITDEAVVDAVMEHRYGADGKRK